MRRQPYKGRNAIRHAAAAGPSDPPPDDPASPNFAERNTVHKSMLDGFSVETIGRKL